MQAAPCISHGVGSGSGIHYCIHYCLHNKIHPLDFFLLSSYLVFLRWRSPYVAHAGLKLLGSSNPRPSASWLPHLKTPAATTKPANDYRKKKKNPAKLHCKVHSPSKVCLWVQCCPCPSGAQGTEKTEGRECEQEHRGFGQRSVKGQRCSAGTVCSVTAKLQRRTFTPWRVQILLAPYFNASFSQRGSQFCKAETI